MATDLLNQKPRFIEDEDDMEDFPIREGLSWYAQKQAEILRSIARGFMLITGEPGGGKDLFAVSTCALFKYIMNRGVVLDFIPRRPFGDYTLCDTSTIISIIREIAKARKVEGIEESEDNKELAQFMEEETVRWLLEGEGYRIFKGKVYYISELKKVAYNRNPNSRTNKFIGTLGTVWRHLDLLLMGTHVKANELDVKAFLEYAKLRTTCEQTMTPHVVKARIHRGMYAGADFVVSNIAMKPLVLYVNGNEPREFLGGYRFYDLYKTKQMSF
jgi:hypothetical protein